jgi:ABC-2 type transport system ATP-binding protein
MQTHKEIGYLPEEPSFLSWMTPGRVSDLHCRYLRVSGKEKKVRTAELLEMAGMKEYAKRRIAGFSRGMRQRLGLAQAMVNRHPFLLLDEPVSALDPMGRKEVLEMIETRGQNCTVLMSTHILEDVERVCGTVAILDKGKRIIQSDREELMNRYANSALELEFNNA